jgi:hypothetical protein
MLDVLVAIFLTLLLKVEYAVQSIPVPRLFLHYILFRFFINGTSHTDCPICIYYFFQPYHFYEIMYLISKAELPVLYTSAGILSVPSALLLFRDWQLSWPLQVQVVLLLNQSIEVFLVSTNDWLNNTWTDSYYRFLMPSLFPIKLPSLFLQKPVLWFWTHFQFVNFHINICVGIRFLGALVSLVSFLSLTVVSVISTFFISFSS